MLRSSGRSAVVSFGILALAAGSCGDNLDAASGIEAFYPELPAPTGEPQASFAGEITAATAGELLTGPSATGMLGDFFIKNDVASFTISAPERVLAVVPTGGNVIDAALLDDAGVQATPDQFGELSLLYLFGRTCDHDSIEIVRDGSDGGVAVLRAHGRSTNNDFINIKGIGVFDVKMSVDPTIDDGVECATTYVLAPGETRLQTYITLFNPTEAEVAGPYGTLADSGGEIESWGNGRGFERASISDITSLSDPAPINYVAYQAPQVAYGIVPRFPAPAAGAEPTTNSAYLIAGVSLMLLGNDNLFDILAPEEYFLHLPAHDGNLQQIDVVVGRDAGTIDAAYRTREAQALTPVAGTVTYTGGAAAVGARVGVFDDLNTDGVIDADDTIVSYLDVDAAGAFAGQVPAAGNHLMRAEVFNVGRSATVAAGATLALEIAPPVTVDFSVLDDDTNMPIPSRLLVIGEHPAFPDVRVFSTYDRLEGVVASQHNAYGTSVSVGDGADPALRLPAGGTYRIYASRGTEWSVASQSFVAVADADLEFRLRHVVNTDGYLATEWHVHQIGSPDSPVAGDARVRSALSAGIEMFAVTDHDFVADLQPIVEDLGTTSELRVLPGLEMTPFAYGHFQAWPMDVDETSPNRGAVDWARGPMAGLGMLPQEIFDDARSRGAQMLQINHPRASGLSKFQAFFDRANVIYDYDNRTIFGDFANAEVPNDWLRLPGQSLWSDDFNGLEVWNGFALTDSDGDGRREIQPLDRVMRDWFSMMSMGFDVCPTASSDSHTDVIDPVGMPRTMVRVSDDSGAALASGAAVDEVLAVTTGAAPRDLVMTDGPMLRVRVGADDVIGDVVAPAGGTVTFTVDITAADWAKVDTLEVFANATPATPVTGTTPTALQPLQCFTTRDLGTLDPADPCLLAPLPPQAMTLTLVDLGGGVARYEATVTIALSATDIAAATRAGATGTDAWVAFRASGDRGILPLLSLHALTADTLATFVAGTDAAALDAALDGHGIPAVAISAPVFLDFDGGGYLAPFAP